jgi:glucosyl-3-phosphoglycerate synthase
LARERSWHAQIFRQTVAVLPVPTLFDAASFDIAALASAKGSTTVSVCIPARDEAATVGRIVDAIRSRLVEDIGLVDEIVVVDDHSTDRTAEIATEAGARVVASADTLPEWGSGHRKGGALWKSVHAATGDIIAWCDADIRKFDERFIIGLIGPMLLQPGVEFVKGFYERPDDGVGGGRVTELLARPAISLLLPELASFVQPLSGEYAGRRSLLERVPFVCGYGVDLGLLVDVVRLVGIDAIAQVDLGIRRHRHRPLDELGPQAVEVLAVALRRANVAVAHPAVLERPGKLPLVIPYAELPPLADLMPESATPA